MNNIEELNYRIKSKISKKWLRCETNYNNAAGLLLEKLIGKQIENFPIADYNGIEIKTKHINSKTKITLFSSVPDSFLFENKRLVQLYGYPDKQYPQFKVLNMMVCTKCLSYVGNNHYFQLYVNKEKKQIVLNIYRGPFELIDNLTSWSFDLLEEKIRLKLKTLCFVSFEKMIYKNTQYVKYNEPEFFELKNFNTFIELIEEGYITVSIKLGIYKSGKKFGQLHDHGSSFDIQEKNIELLYKKIG